MPVWLRNVELSSLPGCCKSPHPPSLSKTSVIVACCADEDLSGDHLLAEAALPLKRILPHNQKKFQLPLEKPNLKVRPPLL